MARQQHVIPMKSLLEAGVHFGHRTPRWNPKMKSYIFTQRNGIHIIDLQQTLRYVDQAYQLVVDTVTSGGIVLFVGTKRQAQDTVQEEANRCGMPYVNQRWLGGTLTNWRTIRERIDYLLELERQQTRGEFSRLVKKEAVDKEKEIARLNKRLGGLKTMRHLPHLLFITDTRRELIAVQEANILGIPILAMVDTNCNPDPIEHIIPSNDDAIRAIRLITGKIADAVLEGQSIRQAEEAEVEEIESTEDEDISRYLGPSTLAHLQAGEDGEADAAAETGEPVVAEVTSVAADAAESTPSETPAVADESPVAEAQSDETQAVAEENAIETAPAGTDEPDAVTES